MSATTLLQVCCDPCGMPGPTGPDAEAARATAALVGWTTRQEGERVVDRCATCSTTTVDTGGRL